MVKPKRVPVPRKPAKSHDELPRHSDWQNPRVVQILDAASRCFARDGFAGTTVQQIAREAGLTKSMIHYYFESKQVLILELQAFIHERYFRRVQSKLDSLSPDSESRVKEALWEVYDVIKDKQFLRLQLETFAEAGRDPNMRNRMMLAMERSREFIDMGANQVVDDSQAQPIKMPASLSLLIQSTLLGLRIQEFLSGDIKMSRRAYELFVAMLTGSLTWVQDESAEVSKTVATDTPPQEAP
ncbi:MAG: hypothetical protein DRI90_09835 [Deltaproteobacteria bacterium]|nr:MAG: hypothetical protein DRI90_09835 [Deltaproteobacteria bacterium]